MLDIQFHGKIYSESVIALLEHVRQKYGKVFMVMDNAAVHTNKTMDGYIEGMGGDVVRWFLPPRTPQHNPIEIQWRESDHRHILWRA